MSKQILSKNNIANKYHDIVYQHFYDYAKNQLLWYFKRVSERRSSRILLGSEVLKTGQQIFKVYDKINMYEVHVTKDMMPREYDILAENLVHLLEISLNESWFYIYVIYYEDNINHFGLDEELKIRSKGSVKKYFVVNLVMEQISLPTTEVGSVIIAMAHNELTEFKRYINRFLKYRETISKIVSWPLSREVLTIQESVINDLQEVNDKKIKNITSKMWGSNPYYISVYDLVLLSAMGAHGLKRRDAALCYRQLTSNYDFQRAKLRITNEYLSVLASSLLQAKHIETHRKGIVVTGHWAIKYMDKKMRKHVDEMNADILQTCRFNKEKGDVAGGIIGMIHVLDKGQFNCEFSQDKLLSITSESDMPAAFSLSGIVNTNPYLIFDILYMSINEAIVEVVNRMVNSNSSESTRLTCYRLSYTDSDLVEEIEINKDTIINIIEILSGIEIENCIVAKNEKLNEYSITIVSKMIGINRSDIKPWGHPTIYKYENTKFERDIIESLLMSEEQNIRKMVFIKDDSFVKCTNKV